MRAIQTRSSASGYYGTVYSCSSCAYRTPRKDNLQRHTRIHTGERPFQCDICHRSFNQKSSLTTHYGIHLRNLPLRYADKSNDSKFDKQC
ncbi:hypothetical protein TNCV_889271 [Trichonephila clavipes]|nr:hypothetical protein TNCV_889271 [Trichonephila clavipes]